MNLLQRLGMAVIAGTRSTWTYKVTERVVDGLYQRRLPAEEKIRRIEELNSKYGKQYHQESRQPDVKVD